MRKGWGKLTLAVVAIGVGVTYLNQKTGNHIPAPFK